jgi:hypothetical protein
LRALAAEFHSAGAHEIDEADFCEMVRRVRASYCVDLEFRDGEFLADVTQAVPLVVRDGLKLRWAHRSLMDYFFAEYFLRDFKGDKNEALRLAIAGDRRRTTENFLTVVHEADPILYADAITVNAIDSLVDAKKDLVSRCGAAAMSKISPHLLSILSSVGLIVDDSDSDGTHSFVERHLKILGDGFDSDSLALFLNLAGRGKPSNRALFVYTKVSLDALLVPIRLGAVSSLTLDEFKEDGLADKFDNVFKSFTSMTFLNLVAISDDKADELRGAMEFVCSYLVRIPTFDMAELAETAGQLRRMIEASVAVRGRPLFKIG